MFLPTLSYQILGTRDQGGRFYTVARITCVCGAHLDRPIPDFKNNPEAIIKKFRSEGWETDGRNPAKNRCLTCQLPESKRPKTVLRVVAEKAAEIATKTPQIPRTLALKPEPEPPPPPTPLTGPQRTTVRKLLEENFDDSTGKYLDGWSDLIVAQAANVPVEQVSQVREAAYGALAEDSELSEIRDKQASLMAQLAEVRDKLSDLAEKQDALEKESLDLTLRLVAAEERLFGRKAS